LNIKFNYSKLLKSHIQKFENFINLKKYNNLKRESLTKKIHKLKTYLTLIKMLTW